MLTLDLCRAFHKLPHEIDAASAELIQLLEIERLGRREPPGGEGGSAYGE